MLSSSRAVRGLHTRRRDFPLLSKAVLDTKAVRWLVLDTALVCSSVTCTRHLLCGRQISRRRFRPGGRNVPGRPAWGRWRVGIGDAGAFRAPKEMMGVAGLKCHRRELLAWKGQKFYMFSFVSENTDSSMIPGWRKWPSSSCLSRQAERRDDHGRQRQTWSSRMLTPQNAQTQYGTWLETQHCKPEKKTTLKIMIFYSIYCSLSFSYVSYQIDSH